MKVTFSLGGIIILLALFAQKMHFWAKIHFTYFLLTVWKVSCFQTALWKGAFLSIQLLYSIVRKGHKTTAKQANGDYYTWLLETSNYQTHGYWNHMIIGPFSVQNLNGATNYVNIIETNTCHQFLQYFILYQLSIVDYKHVLNYSIQSRPECPCALPSFGATFIY